MPEPIVLPGNVVAGMPQALRAELGIEPGRSAQVVAVSVPAVDVPDVVRLLRLLASRLSHRPALSESRTQALLAAIGTPDTPSNLVADLEVDNAILARAVPSMTTRRTPAARSGSCRDWPRGIRPNRRHAGSATAASSAFRSAIRIATRPSSLPRDGRDPRSRESCRYFPPTCRRGRSRSGSRRANRWIEEDNAPQEALHDIDRVLAAAADLASDNIG